jgi:hypothetical protein
METQAINNNPKNCFKIGFREEWASSNSTNYCYLELWDEERQTRFSVLYSLFTDCFAMGPRQPTPFDNCPEATAEMQAKVAAEKAENRRLWAIRDQVTRDYIESLKAHLGQTVIVVKGRKVPKGTTGRIEKIYHGQWGPSVLLTDGEWVALGNVKPVLSKPEEEYLQYYYERADYYFFK